MSSSVFQLLLSIASIVQHDPPASPGVGLRPNTTHLFEDECGEVLCVKLLLHLVVRHTHAHQ